MPSARFTTLAFVAIGATFLGSCSVPAAEGVIGKQWQVAAVYDDPNLPPAAPEGKVPPTISIGGQSYSVTSQCEVVQGSVEWRGEAVVIGEPQSSRTTECDDQDRTFSDRFKNALSGEFLFEVGENGLRMKKIGEYQPGTTVPGWSAVQTEGR